MTEEDFTYLRVAERIGYGKSFGSTWVEGSCGGWGGGGLSLCGGGVFGAEF